MIAELIAIGSELLTPEKVDTNSVWLTEQLNSVGITVRMKTIVGDDELPLEDVLRDALRRSDLVISTGGLGPTEDDITRKVVARVLGRPLVLDDAILEHLRALFARFGRPMTPNNERQALVLRDDVLPLLHLRDVVRLPRRDARGGQVVVLEVADRRAGMVVDELTGQQEIVIKPFDAVKDGLSVFSGATILGDGVPALILDVSSLI